jgi:hypothetical protein
VSRNRAREGRTKDERGIRKRVRQRELFIGHIRGPSISDCLIFPHFCMIPAYHFTSSSQSCVWLTKGKSNRNTFIHCKPMTLLSNPDGQEQEKAVKNSSLLLLTVSKFTTSVKKGLMGFRIRATWDSSLFTRIPS